jgi:hydrogenase nickel incorporation protein HypB
VSIITVERKVLARNDLIAEENRAVFKQHHVFVLNLLSSPGSGKTTLLERTIARLKDKLSIAVIEGDVQTDLDAQRIKALGVQVTQIITSGGCHLEAKLIKQAMETMIFDDAQLVIIENVGNLVCPAGYDLGEDSKVVILSVTEGEEKPLKYPAMFRNAAVCVINKIDLLPYVKCSLETLTKNALSINPQLQIFTTSCTTDEGLEEWCNWLLSKVRKQV